MRSYQDKAQWAGLAEHVQFTVDSGVQVYFCFCDPRSPLAA
jgi:hypothetical protein